MTKDKMAKALSEFLVKRKVDTISLSDYKGLGNDVPVKDYLLRRAFGSWSRVLSAMQKRYPIDLETLLAPAPAPAPKPAPKKVTPKKTVVKPKVEKKDVK
jgi:hypothetical protein